MTKSAAQRKLLTLNFLTCSCNALTTKIYKAVPFLSGEGPPPRISGMPYFCHSLLEQEGALDLCVCVCVFVTVFPVKPAFYFFLSALKIGKRLF